MNMENDTNGKIIIVITDYECREFPVFQIWFDDKLLMQINIEKVTKDIGYYSIWQEKRFFIIDNDIMSLMSKEQISYFSSILSFVCK